MNIALSGSSASIANRVSYFCNFHGPSMSLDTMCSSSLTAIHLACQSLQKGGCELAIAGGVNVSIHPNKYLMLSQGKFASSTGQCESFGEGGDGYVPGEGVGALLLKSKAKAIADGDHIYGIIKATAINHGGKTNGYTVPNPNAQSSVIHTALKEAGIDPRTVSYIEAHGTGTSLGDPIEIAGLNKAFQQYTQDKQFCAIGSAKSNIGHCESAAGIAGVTKVLLQLKHRQLVPSLHSKVLNDNIDFANSPFVVQQELAEWERPLIEKNGVTTEYPRIAGISSFGAGGSNAHVVIEEYVPQAHAPIVVTQDKPALIVLSARNPERLREQARQLLEAIAAQTLTDADLADMAYTLQVGREAMEERMAVMASSFSDLQAKLDAFVAGQGDIDGLYQGQVKRNKDALGIFAADEEMQEAIAKWMQRGKYSKLLDVWVKGMAFDWSKMYGAIKPRRISLPTYPFAQERYWVPRAEALPKAGVVGAAQLHPLLQRNTSDLSEQRFSSTFSGTEFFLADHMVQGKRILPGVAYLEMARAAALHASGPVQGQGIGLRLQNIVWSQPIVVEAEPVEVHIGLYGEDDGAISYEIYSAAPDGDAIVHSEGVAILGSSDVTTIDIETVQAQCTTAMTSAQCYEIFKQIGLAYGASHQAISELHIGHQQVLAGLRLPGTVGMTATQYVLHPSIMDGALQATLGLALAEGKTKPSLPFALGELEIIQPCTSSMWALVRYSAGSQPGDALQKLDIDLCDEQGTVCVRLKGFTSRIMDGDATAIGTVLLQPQWTRDELAQQGATTGHAQHVVLLCGLETITSQQLERELPSVRCLQIVAPAGDLAASFQHHARSVFEEVQALMLAKPGAPVLCQIVVPVLGRQQVLAALSSLLKTARLENPKLLGQLIAIEETDAASLAAILRANASCPQDQHIRYDNGTRWIAGWKESIDAASVHHPWKDHGIYLITGGAGGLGLLFAKEIATQVRAPVLILTGRSALAADKQLELDELIALGARVQYQQVDVAHASAVTALMENIRAEFGQLNGILHSAGVTRDSFLIKKTLEEFNAVLAPKVDGLVHLDAASKDFALDFLIAFSSSAGALGNIGQADYATGNAFMDAFATYRNSLVALEQRHGQTFSVNWPLWKDGGMHVDASTEQLMTRNTGLVAMPTEKGIAALYRALAAKQDQIMVLEGNLKRIAAAFTNPAPVVHKPVTAPVAATLDINSEKFQQKALEYFKQLMSSAMKLPVDRIQVDTAMEEYGIDSVMVMQLTSDLEKVFGSLSKTLFFEYQTIQALTDYFIADYRQKLTVLLGVEAQSAEIPKEPVVAAAPALPIRNSRRRPRSSSVGEPAQVAPNMEIAIIGLSGRYPQAKNMQAFWENLRDGKDCITEIPADRWDHSLYFDADKDKPGKTYSKWGGFIDGVDQFDPLFFNISALHAEYMDPQERLFLQCAYETLEDAGYTRETLGHHRDLGLDGNVGVYVGVMYEEYQLYGAQAQMLGAPFALSGSGSSIANRVSYFCNFHGPSMAVDTMCSSALTAIQLACQSLQTGGCEVAIAGGVNVSIHPNKYLLLGQAKFVSGKGRCESFGEGGEGYVPSEGVGAVLLKPLAKAVADGDHIYGVIKGATTNHGGKTNGYSVPNPNAQNNVIGRAFKDAGIDARAVSYIEAHGTGTSLGDPIEIAGLNKAFQQFTQEKQFCSIGSAKSNIGHCESAAGIAGLTKVLLQLKHRQLVPSLHSKELNPHIDFANSPFVVQQELAEWKRPVIEVDGRMKEFPRIAGVSSFGAGGSNAHILIEEYIPKQARQRNIRISAANPALIVLSAKNKERLREQAQRLLEVIVTDADLADMAYTLQVGREAMEERLAMVVVSIDDLTGKLNEYVAGRQNLSDVFHGQVKRNNDALGIFAADDDMGKAIDAWVGKGKFGKLLDLWVKGLAFDWSKLYGDAKPRRISLPTYPFAKERYWVPEFEQKMAAPSAGAGNNAVLHPLLHRNTSDLSEQRFSSTFSGDEFFLADHVVHGKRVLPGVAYLEMARAAAVLASGSSQEKGAGMRLQNIVWSRPIVVEAEPVDVHIGLYPADNGAISYEIYSAASDGNPVVHSQGVALTGAKQAAAVDIGALQAQCTRHMSSVECYELFKQIGLTYGVSHQAISDLHIGRQQVLAKLRLPATVAATGSQYMLHPSMMDAALQATLGLAVSEGQGKPALPFALQELEIIRTCTSTMWALVRYSAGSRPGDTLQKLDIAMCDEHGAVCVRLKGFTSRVMEGEVPVVTGTLLLQPEWTQRDIASETASVHAQHIVLLCGVDGVTQQQLEIEMPAVRCVRTDASPLALGDSFRHHAQLAFSEIQALLLAKPTAPVLFQVVVPVLGQEQVLAALSGLLKTARMENPKLLGQLIAVEDIDAGGLADLLHVNANHARDQHIRYEDGTRWIAGWKEIAPAEPARLPWKDNGIYLITGGVGGLGLVFAKEIASKVKAPTLVLTGRSKLPAAKRPLLEELVALGARVEYQQVDVTQADEVKALMAGIRDECGQLNGILHSAGITRDSFLIKKTAEDFNDVLGPKVDGLIHLDEASKDIALDFLIAFSSTAGALGNIGQADYATGNAFMDAYAGYRNSLVALEQRHGQTLSVNWPLWKEGGMHIDASTEQMMSRSTGMVAMPTASGIAALYRALAAGQDQVLVLEGDLKRIGFLIPSKESGSAADDAYLKLAAQIESGELSEEQFEKIFMH